MLFMRGSEKIKNWDLMDDFSIQCEIKNDQYTKNTQKRSGYYA